MAFEIDGRIREELPRFTANETEKLVEHIGDLGRIDIVLTQDDIEALLKGASICTSNEGLVFVISMNEPGGNKR